jgi:probable blue pigment (indigoidine) exporter
MGDQENVGSKDLAIGQISAAVAAVLFGTAYVATSIAFRSFTPLGAAMSRGLLSTLVLLPAVLLTRQSGAGAITRSQTWRLIILGLCGGLGFVVALNLAVSNAGATLPAFAASMSPILAAVLAPLVLREALTIPAVVGFTAAVAGTALLSGTSSSGADGPGILFGLLAALCFALFLLLSRRWSRSYRLTGGAIALSIAATTGLGLLPVELIREPGLLLPANLRPDATIALIWLALVPGVLAQLFVVASVRRVKTRSSAAMLLVSPLTAAVLAGLLLGETLNAPQLLGAALILAGTVGAAGLGGERIMRTTAKWFGRPPRRV